ncbi:MAG TPA: ferric iron reductase [Acidimicrobiales bacterium]|nr:ferric iron reductase [Acidimicrobiales bacterium]
MTREPVVLRAEEACSALSDGMAKVTAFVPYLKAEVGPVTWAATRTEPADAIVTDGKWLSCHELIDDPRWLQRVVRASGVAIGTEDLVIAASIFVQGYSYRLLALSVALATAAGIVPGLDPMHMAVACSRGRIAKVAYMAPTAVDFKGGRSSVRDAFGDASVADDVLHLILAEAVESHLRLLVASVRREKRVGERLLWGNIAASASTAFRTMEGCLGPWVIPLGERFFELAPPDLTGLGSFFLLEQDGRHGWFWERTNCCLFDRLPGKIRCSDCSMTPAEERRAAYAASLTSTGGES